LEAAIGSLLDWRKVRSGRLSRTDFVNRRVEGAADAGMGTGAAVAAAASLSAVGVGPVAMFFGTLLSAISAGWAARRLARLALRSSPMRGRLLEESTSHVALEDAPIFEIQTTADVVESEARLDVDSILPARAVAQVRDVTPT
jgi:hypothetical protein